MLGIYKNYHLEEFHIDVTAQSPMHEASTEGKGPSGEGRRREKVVSPLAVAK